MKVIINYNRCSFSFILTIRDQRERRSPLTKIVRPSFPHLGKSQGSTAPQCNETASPWGNCLVDHSLPLRQVSMLNRNVPRSTLFSTANNATDTAKFCTMSSTNQFNFQDQNALSSQNENDFQYKRLQLGLLVFLRHRQSSAFGQGL